MLLLQASGRAQYFDAEPEVTIDRLLPSETLDKWRALENGT